jgi:hypothetical protein
VLQRVHKNSGKDLNFAAKVIAVQWEEQKKMKNYNAMGQCNEGCPLLLQGHFFPVPVEMAAW